MSIILIEMNKNRTEFSDTSNQKNAFFGKLRIIASLLLFGFAVFTVLYYIWSDYYIEEYHSDTAEMVLWAESCLESKRLVNPDFRYIYLLPFSGHLFLIPFVKILGPRVLAQRAGMTCFSLFFIFIIFRFISVVCGEKKRSLIWTSLLILALNACGNLRSMYWGHTVYYCLSILFLMGALVLIDKYENPSTRGIIFAAGVFLCFFMGAADGTTMLALFTVPVLVAALIEFILSEGAFSILKKDRLVLFGLILAASLAGFLFFRCFSVGLESNYSESFLSFAKGESWISHFSLIFQYWISLFLDFPAAEIPFISGEGINLFIRILAFILTTFFTLISPFFYKYFTRVERRISWITWIISFETIFGYLFGNLATENWRMIPMYFLCVLETLLCLRSLTHLSVNAVFFSAAGTILMILFGMICGVSVLTHNIDTDRWYGKNSIISVLHDNGLNFGYTIDFWNGNAITILSNGNIKSRELRFSEDSGKLEPSRMQTNIHWYEEKNKQGKIFLICQEPDYFKYQALLPEAERTIRVDQKSFFTDSNTVGLVILIFDHDFLNDPGN